MEGLQKRGGKGKGETMHGEEGKKGRGGREKM
jgi:hypothetical protein